MASPDTRLTQGSVFIKMSVKVHVMVVTLKTKGSCRNNAITAICCRAGKSSVQEALMSSFIRPDVLVSILYFFFLF